MQPQRKHAYDFDFGNMELIPPEVFKMIILQMMSNGNTTFQQMHFTELARVAQTISYARHNKICHGEFDWALARNNRDGWPNLFRAGVRSMNVVSFQDSFTLGH